MTGDALFGALCLQLAEKLRKVHVKLKERQEIKEHKGNALSGLCGQSAPVTPGARPGRGRESICIVFKRRHPCGTMPCFGLGLQKPVTDRKRVRQSEGLR